MRFDQAVRSITSAVAIAGSCLFTTVASAQVGHLPTSSPYEDLKPTQDLSIFAGHLGSRLGEAGVLPKPSLFGGIRYDVAIGGPAFLTARYIMAPSERAVLLPSNSKSTRYLGSMNTTTHEADVGISVALTGRKSWRRMIPTVSGGLGLVSDFAKPDTGGYKFGTKFSVNYGLNVRYVLRNGFGVRAEATNFLWQHKYPDSYLIPATSDTTSVLKSADQRTGWNSHWGLSVGLVIPIFR